MNDYTDGSEMKEIRTALCSVYRSLILLHIYSVAQSFLIFLLSLIYLLKK